MKRSIAAMLALSLLSLPLVGCGGSAPIKVENIAVNPADQIKAQLSNVLETGQLGSEQTSIEEAITNMSSQDAAKGAALKKVFDELVNASTPASKKAKAKELAGLL